jgi:heavy metal sensor kinase
MIRSFRWQMTLWYLGLFSVLLVLFGVFLYEGVENALRTRLDERLVSEADTAAGLLQDELKEMNGDISLASAEAASEMRLQGTTVAIFHRGALIASSSPVGQLFRLPALWSLHDGQIADAGPHRAAGRIVHGDCLVVAVAPLDSITGDLAVLRRILLIALPVALLLAGIGGYVLAARKLAPLHSMAQQARHISGENLHSRLEIGNAAEELITLAASFNELLSRLDQSFDSMKRFVADASHELRTPISVIRGEADVALATEHSPAAYRESLAIILDESRRLSRLVDDLLNLARADAGHVRLQICAFYFNDLLMECCRSVQALAAARAIELDCRPGDDAPFFGDEELLRRLVVNLLDNAIRYTPAGGRVVALLEPEEGGVRLRVTDTGPGIAPEVAAHVFERFYRADKARSRGEGGFGLGRSIVKWIAESHHGVVELTSRAEKGSTFTVTLPR